MTITRSQLLNIGYTIKAIKERNKDCNINLKYKIIKLESFLKNEFEITSELLENLTDKYAILDEKGNKIIKNNGVKIQAAKALELQKELNDFQNYSIQVPDYYFSLEELSELNLSWEEVEYFLPFTKD